jgi:hypothetical protein
MDDENRIPTLEIVELHEGYLQLGGMQLSEHAVRAILQFISRVFPTGWRIKNGHVLPITTDPPTRTAEWLRELEVERAAKAKPIKKKTKAKAKKKTLARRKPKPKVLKLKRRK